MAIDENKLFREATLRICGDLEIENAMVSFLQYINQFMAADRLFMEYFDEGLNAMCAIVDATPKKGKKTDLVTPISKEAKSFIYNGSEAGMRDIIVYDDPMKVSLTRELLESIQQKAASLLVMPLGTADRLLGYIVLISEEKQYTTKETRLFSRLKEPFNIAMANALKHKEVTDLKNLLADENQYLHGELRRLSGDEVIGAKFGLKDVMLKVEQVSALDSPVIIFGETGVGKDIIANMIHYSSLRANGPFISVNCGAIPDSLIDSELFGHEKGAFTDARTQRQGIFEAANGGTLFLDEIGEMTLSAQVRLL
ncbi:MAG: sigma-54 factor interaction domain-containing protein, partial [Calditrichaeota bacterium]|nr:sigma-54 factor interaction domain-containing protein [Calditrichota bacterium]